MDLVGQIINDLIDVTIPLQQAFYKALVVAKRLKNEPLLEWVNNELNGYSKKVPDYRIVRCDVVGDLISLQGLLKNVPIPIMFLDQELQEELESIYIGENIAGLERVAADEQDKPLLLNIEQEKCAYITAIMNQNGDRRRVLYAQKVVPTRVTTSIVSIIRTRLLNTMEDLSEELNNYDPSLRTEIKPNKSLNEKIVQIMNHYNIHSSGNGNVVNTGHNNDIKVKTQIVKNDLEHLRQSLRKVNVSPEDIGELERILTVEQPDLQQGQLGPQANSWIGTMFSKALNGTWQLGSQIATGTAGGLLVEIIKNFYGM